MPNCRHARRYFVCSGQQFSAAFGRHIAKIIFERFTNKPLCSSLLLSKGDCGLPLRIPNGRREHAQPEKGCYMVRWAPRVPRGMPSPQLPRGAVESIPRE